MKQAQASYVSATMTLSAPSVDPGNSIRLNITVRNDSSIVDYFEFSVPDIPQQWLTLPPVLRLMDRQQQSVTIIIQPPRVPQSRAGTHPFTVHVTSTSNRKQSVTLQGTFTINAYTSFTSDMHPQNLRPQQEANVTLENQGNALEYFTLTWRDKANAVTFTPPQTRVDIKPGDKEDIPFRAKPHKRPWIGGETSMPFNVEIAPAKGVAQTQSGTIINQARFPVWMLTVVFMLCIVLSVLGGFLYKDQTEKQANATAATATAAQAILDATATVEQAQQAATATAESASLAATATATWLDADDDDDGLTNREEIEWGTDPNVKDSDGDTIWDGAEVHGWTRDGETFYTHPMNRDTDGDGLPDNTDPNAGQLPTLTPTYVHPLTPALTETSTPHISDIQIPGSTPAPLSTPDIGDLLRQRLDQLPKGLIGYDSITRATVDVPFTIRAYVIADSYEDAGDTLIELLEQDAAPESRPRVQTIHVSELLGVRLVAQDPRDFAITSLHTEEHQLIGGADPTNWSWSVLPLRAGRNKKLELRVSAIVSIPGTDKERIKDFEPQIITLSINVNPGYAILAALKHYGWLLILLIAGYIYLRRRNRLAAESPALSGPRGLSADLCGRLRLILTQCEPFASDADLHTLFTDARIASWRDDIPQANAAAARVRAVVAYLHNQYTDTGENALVLFLHVLAENIDPGDILYRELRTLAADLEHTFAERPTD